MISTSPEIRRQRPDSAVYYSAGRFGVAVACLDQSFVDSSWTHTPGDRSHNGAPPGNTLVVASAPATAADAVARSADTNVSVVDGTLPSAPSAGFDATVQATEYSIQNGRRRTLLASIDLVHVTLHHDQICA
jgi:hypothetical protein